MWKLKCIYEDGGRVTITGKDKAITKELYSKYMTLYGNHANQALYQQYPKRKYREVDLKLNPTLPLLEQIREIEINVGA
jgi:vacuolar-type H+-ATPase catalytic subunit A/Vma1